MKTKTYEKSVWDKVFRFFISITLLSYVLFGIYNDGVFIPASSSYNDMYFTGFSAFLLLLATVFFSLTLLIPIYEAKLKNTLNMKVLKYCSFILFFVAIITELIY